MIFLTHATRLYTDTEILERMASLYQGVVITNGDLQVLANILDIDFHYLRGYLKTKCPNNDFFKEE